MRRCNQWLSVQWAAMTATRKGKAEKSADSYSESLMTLKRAESKQ